MLQLCHVKSAICEICNSNGCFLFFNKIEFVPLASASLFVVSDKPHNAIINAGALVVVSLIKKELQLADRFDYVSKDVDALKYYLFR